MKALWAAASFAAVLLASRGPVLTSKALRRAAEETPQEARERRLARE